MRSLRMEIRRQMKRMIYVKYILLRKTKGHVSLNVDREHKLTFSGYRFPSFVGLRCFAS